ncbi:NAD(P)-binding protein [Suhomyces tanzawaensis NRRL Y-17324]|uniref:NAD(P)-binding protein n=1 Tax=Suhomyces tanzawaensis NRRL Y-17324 TaxID=984487 RepID=A0A1E4SP57_9ASCO|nr:NAD(P)-binding protein [Suhomyces tanzawaensis NRRL Y-17324]ODV81309.1 NAD(P)-binding protein [Suhomyces tanzawaensis NRRL Y-17324]
MSSTVFVSGATGYIAQHLVQQLLDKNYTVIGSVRSEAKGENLKAHFPKNFEYVVVPDMGKEGAFDAALQKYPEISAFLHTASPYNFSDEDVENNLLKPALEGTRNALASAKAYGKNVKRFIVTSSYAAHSWTHLVDKTIPEDIRVTEESWTEISWEQAKANGLVAYIASKAIAEKEVWRFQKEENPSFDIAAVNPTYVFGPHLFDSEVKAPLNESTEAVNSFLKLKSEDDIFQYKGLFIDVRDVATAHVVALEKPEASNQRIILSAGPFSQQVILNEVHESFPELKHLPKGDPASTPKTLVRVMHGDLDDSKSREILGFEFIPFDKCINDSIAQLIRTGFP